MTFTQLTYFISVAKHGSITKAANALYIEQPALSRVISRLEADLGIHLFDRRGRAIVLNDTGKIFLDFAEQCLNSYYKMQHNIAQQSCGYYGNLSIATSIKSSRVYDIVAEFHRCWPTIHLCIKHVKSPDEAHDCDFVFGLSDYETTYLQNSFAYHSLWNEVTCLLVSKQNPLSAKKTVKLNEAQDQSFILSLDKQFKESSMKFFQLANFSPLSTLKTDDPNLVFYLVQKNLGVALLHEFTPFYNSIEGIQLVPISVPEYYRHVFLFSARQKSATKIHKLFEDFVITHSKLFLDTLGT